MKLGPCCHLQKVNQTWLHTAQYEAQCKMLALSLVGAETTEDIIAILAELYELAEELVAESQ